MPGPVLVALTESHRRAYLDYIDAFRTAREPQYVDRDATEAGFPRVVRRLRREAAGIDLEPGYVPATTWFLWDGCSFLGRISIRHRLTPRLEDFGGHIGYEVRPSARRRGHGTRMLALALQQARALGLQRVLVTCDPDNRASVGVIERNGGRLASRSPAITANLRPTLRYWIDIPPAKSP